MDIFTHPYSTVEERDFQKEKAQLMAYLNKTMNLGKDYFEQLDNSNFGKLSMEEWNILYYKHLDHHLSQIGG